ncbi:MAG: T9SS type A sorting domain-containing protein [Vicingaceae bacterium]
MRLFVYFLLAFLPLSLLAQGDQDRSSDFKSSDKSSSSVYLNYYDVELNGYGFGNSTQVPSFYHVMDDSNYTCFATAFTHIFDFATFNLIGFDSLLKKYQGNDRLSIDSIALRMGHVNHSGQQNTMIVSLRELNAANGPVTNGALLWSDTLVAINLTSFQKLGMQKHFSYPVGLTIASRDRGFFLEVCYDGVYGMDSASFVCDYLEMSCALGTGASESFTYHAGMLQDGRSFFKNASIASSLGIGPNSFFSNFDTFRDCNSNSTYDKGIGEASFTQNIDMGFWYTYELLGGLNHYSEALIKNITVYPNPINEVAYIEYTLLSESHIALKINDLTGKSVSYRNVGKKSTGNHKIIFDASTLNSGLYFYSLVTDKGNLTGKIVVQH